jgi:hypothetical protein
VNLLATKISKEFGVNLKDFNGIHIMTLDNKAKQSDEFFPFIWKVIDEYKELLNHIKIHDVAIKQTLGIGSQHDL